MQQAVSPEFNAQILHTAIIVAIIISVTTLGMFDKISGDALVALISGLVGYGARSLTKKAQPESS